MKRLFIFGFLLIVSIFIIVSCASKPNVELVQASAQIVTDISLSGQTGIMDGNKLIKYVTPTVLSYTFIVKNTGSNKIGDTQKPVKFKLEPNEELISTLKETVGLSVFEKMNGGYMGEAEIFPDKTAKYSIFYELGTAEDLGAHSPLPRLPSTEKLDELKKKRFEATLILTVGEEEIARFDLRPFANGLAPEVQQQMEQELGTKMVVPEWEGYQVKFAAVQYPPIINNQAVGDRRIATIVYTDQKGPLIELTAEQKEQIEKRQRRRFFYGEFEGKPMITMEVSNEKGRLMDAKVQQIEGIEVEYDQKVVESGNYAFYSFNLENASYLITFQLNQAFQEEDAVRFIRSILSSQ